MVVELDDETRRQLIELFKRLRNPVKIYLFTTRGHCLYCNETEAIVDEVASLSKLIEVVKCECETDSEEARRFGVERHPAIIIHGERPYGIRYFGIPSGYEFGTLVEAIMAASTGESGLPPAVEEMIRGVEEAVHIKVFVTPTCPYCPLMATTAHRFALLNQNITADVIEAVEFPELAQRYSVMAVPKTIINDRVAFEGAIPEREFAELLIKAVGG